MMSTILLSSENTKINQEYNNNKKEPSLAHAQHLQLQPHHEGGEECVARLPSTPWGWLCVMTVPESELV